MRKTLTALIALLLLLSCSDDPGVRPMIGTYLLIPGETAAVSYKSDDTFIYSESVGDYEGECVLTGKYSVSLDQYNFKTARGKLSMTVTSSLDGYENLLLGKNNSIEFYWSSNDEEPVLTWIFDSADSSKNYTFKRIGEEDMLDDRLEEE